MDVALQHVARREQPVGEKFPRPGAGEGVDVGVEVHAATLPAGAGVVSPCG